MSLFLFSWPLVIPFFLQHHWQDECNSREESQADLFYVQIFTSSQLVNGNARVLNAERKEAGEGHVPIGGDCHPPRLPSIASTFED